MHSRIKTALVLFALSGLVAVSYWRQHQQRFDVNSTKVTRASLVDSTLASGHLEYQRQIKLTSELMGRVTKVPVVEGQQVRQGEVLLQLDATNYQLELDKAVALQQQQQLQLQQTQARLTRLEQQVRSMQQLVQRHLQGHDMLDALRNDYQVALLQRDAALSALTQAKAAVAQSQQWLAKTTFVAPMDGVVISVDVEPGETVIPGTTNLPGSDLLTLADTSALYAELRVDEADIGQISQGQEAMIYAAASPNKAYQGQVVSIASAARQQGQSQALTFAVKVRLLEPDAQLFPGMSCRAELKNQARQHSLLIPAAALQQQFVWRIRNQQLEKVAVTTGISNDTHIEVLSGLSEGDDIVQGPGRVFASLVAGAAVHVQQEAPHDAH